MDIKTDLFLIIQYQLDAETLSESLTGLSSTLDPKALSKKSNTEIQLQLEVRAENIIITLKHPNRLR